MLNDTLAYLYPGAKPGDWLLQDDGAGPYIKVWRRLDAQPTQATLDANAGAALFSTQKSIERTNFLTMREQMLNRFAQMVDEFKAATDAVAGAAAIVNINGLSAALLTLMSDARVVAATDLLSLKVAMRARYNEIMGTAAVPGMASVDVKAAYNRRNA